MTPNTTVTHAATRETARAARDSYAWTLRIGGKPIEARLVIIDREFKPAP